MISLIIAGGGESSRFGKKNKLLTMLDDMPVFLHSVKRIGALCNEVIMTVPSQLRTEFEETARTYLPGSKITFVAGGNTRTASIRNALTQLSPHAELVAIHDGARPLATEKLFNELVEVAKKRGASIPGTRMTDTIKEVDATGTVVKTLDRTMITAIQTPQVFNLKALLEAYTIAGEFTDDAAIMEEAGKPVAFVENPEPNFKITFEEDLIKAADVIRKSNDLRQNQSTAPLTPTP